MADYVQGDATSLIGTPALALKYKVGQDNSGGTDGNKSILQVNSCGALRVMGGDSNVYKPVKAVSINAGTPTAVWTPAAGKRWRLKGWELSCSTAGASVLFCDGGASNAEIHRTAAMAAGIGRSSPPNLGEGITNTSALLGSSGALNLDVSITCVVSGFVYGIEE